jgi:hypothetical protein
MDEAQIFANEGFREFVLSLADGHYLAMQDMTPLEKVDHVKGFIDTMEVVFGVYQKSAARGDVGYVYLKGRRTMLAAIASGKVERLLIAAIPFDAEAQAIGIAEILGDTREVPH